MLLSYKFTEGCTGSQTCRYNEIVHSHQPLQEMINTIEWDVFHPSVGCKQQVAYRMTYMNRAMIAALISPDMGTVTNQAMKIFLNRRQSTDFLERSHPTATTDPTCVKRVMVRRPPALRKGSWGPYLAVGRADRKADVRRHNDCERRCQLDAEAAGMEGEVRM